MKRDKPPYLRDYELKRWGELSLRYFAKQCAEEAKTLERAAAIARDKASWFLAAANAKATVYRVGMLTGQPEADPDNASRLAAFRQALGKFGWLEGQNLQIDIRWGAGDPGRMRVLAKELSGLAPDIVVAESTPATAALRQEMPNVPIVFSQVANPVGAGFAASLARPGGNITGVTNFEPSMGGKWLELLKEVAPRIAGTESAVWHCFTAASGCDATKLR